jgi:hypothetical protein
MRDDFAIPVKETLAKRVAQRCSRPECRQVTSGPQEDPEKTINVGVAAHITAASPGGPRYDDLLTPERRQGIENGVWLCQTCAKLIDNDPLRYTCEVLHEWKREAEKTTRSELEQRIAPQDNSLKIFVKLEKLMPDLLSEMRTDLKEYPLRREFVLLKKNWKYWPGGDELVYYFDDHAELEGMIYVLLNNNLIKDITFNEVARYIMTEEVVDYLCCY